MAKKATFCLAVLMTAIITIACSQVAIVGAARDGNMNATAHTARANTIGRQPNVQGIASGQVPDNVHNAFTRELRRFSLNYGDVFVISVRDSTHTYIFSVRMTNINEGNASYYVFREPRR